MRVVHDAKELWAQHASIRYLGYFGGALLLNRIYRLFHRKVNNYPPGETGFWFIGSSYSLLFTGGLAKYYIYISNTFGPISMSYFGITPVVFLNDLNVLRKTFKNPKMLWRGDSLEGTAYPTIGRTGSLQNTNGKLWRFRRQITHKTFTLLTTSEYIGKRIYKLIKDELFPVMDYAAKHNKYYFSRVDLKYSMFAFLFTAMFGDILEIPSKSDKEFVYLLNLVDKIFKNLQRKKIIDFFVGKNNFLNYFLKRQMNIEGPQNEMFLLVKSWVQKYKSTTSNMYKNDFQISEDCYVKRMLQYISNDQDQSLQNIEHLSWNNLYSDASTLFMTALHITLSQMESALYIVAKYDTQQELVYKELKMYYETHDIFNIKDIKHLNKFKAFIYEIMRFNGVIRQTLPRNVNFNDLKINGYNIPNGAIVIGNSTAIMNSTANWTNPEIFDLNHFIDHNTGKFIKPDAFLAFGYGRRSCVAENFALRELYAVLAPLLHRYKFSIPQTSQWKIDKDQWATSTVKQKPLYVQMRF